MLQKVKGLLKRIDSRDKQIENECIWIIEVNGMLKWKGMLRFMNTVMDVIHCDVWNIRAYGILKPTE